MRLEFTNHIDELKEERFVFYCSFKGNVLEVSLDSFTVMTRATKRSKFKHTYGDPAYDRVYTRKSNVKLEDIVIPEDMKTEIRTRIMQSIKMEF